MIPLSYLLTATGQAMIETDANLKSFVKTSLYLPSIKFEKPAASKEEARENWEIQREVAEKDSKFVITFLGNFKQLVLRLAQSM